jgi:hypothetical protein
MVAIHDIAWIQKIYVQGKLAKLFLHLYNSNQSIPVDDAEEIEEVLKEYKYHHKTENW